MLHVVHGIAEIVEQSRFGCQSLLAVRKLQKHELKAFRHYFSGLPLTKIVSIQYLVRAFMKGKIHESDKIYRRKSIVRRTAPFNLLLDTEGRIKNCSLKEIVLPCNLHLDNESGPVGINAFHIDQSILLPLKRINVLLLNIGKILDVMLGNKFFQKHNEKILVRFRAECPFEPMVHDDSGISPDNR